jgi:hypothetical protein
MDPDGLSFLANDLHSGSVIMDPDGLSIFTTDQNSGDDFATDAPPSGNCLANDAPPNDGSTNDVSSPKDFQYTPDELLYLQSVEDEAYSLFPPGKIYPCPAALRDDIRSFAYKKGFEVTSDGWKILCSRCAEPLTVKSKREQRLSSGVVPPEKRRNPKKTTRCGCPFRISYSLLQKNNREDKSLKINESSNYRHDRGCLPSRSQLFREKRKAGAYTKSIQESKIKSILTLLKTGERVPPRIMRKLLGPLLPGGCPLDCQFLYNFHIKAQKLLASKGGEVENMTITEEEESMLVNPLDLDSESPDYYTASFCLINQLLEQALLNPTDTAQIESYLESLAQEDASFKWRSAKDDDGKPICYVWQTGVMRRDFELYGSTLFWTDWVDLLIIRDGLC